MVLTILDVKSRGERGTVGRRERVRVGRRDRADLGGSGEGSAGRRVLEVDLTFRRELGEGQALGGEEEASAGQHSCLCSNLGLAVRAGVLPLLTLLLVVLLSLVVTVVTVVMAVVTVVTVVCQGRERRVPVLVDKGWKVGDDAVDAPGGDLGNVLGRVESPGPDRKPSRLGLVGPALAESDKPKLEADVEANHVVVRVAGKGSLGGARRER